MLYEYKQEYHGHIRKEISDLLPGRVSRILEIGCGAGETLSFLKSNGYCDWICGVELVPEAAEIARTKLDCVYQGNVETMELPIAPASLDAILCLDVLEHLVSPEKTVARLHTLLAPQGVLIASIPNVRHHSALLPLLACGAWNYTDSGILDRTHLRFFVRNTAIALVECSGLKVDRVESTYGDYKDRLVSKLSLGLLQPFCELQYLVRAKRVE